MFRKYLIPALLLSAVLPATAAMADVKSGVEAWTRGDYAAAVREWQVPAARGDADAQFNLGQAYKLGRGVQQDLTKAEDLFGKAAAQGHLQGADNYGLLLFQRGQRAQALPFIGAAAGRGDPRAQYLLGIAHFNGDGVAKDWVRAYALVSLAQQAQLSQAGPALAQMDQHIPIEQRQQAVQLAAELAAQADATRTQQLAAADLGTTVPSGASQRPAIRPAPVAQTPGTVVPRPASMPAAAGAPVRVAADDSPRSAGADFTRPAAAAPVFQPAPAPVRQPNASPVPAYVPAPSSRPAPAAAPDASGPWRVQLGAFGVAANADAQWNRVKGRPELAGHPRINVRSGAVTRLQAGGFASREAAQAACTRMVAAGHTCVPARN